MKTYLSSSALMMLALANPTSAQAEPANGDPNADKKDIVVTGYALPQANTATKTDTPLLLTPLTIEVLPAQLLRDQAITSGGLARALRNVGVMTPGTAPATEGFNFRGFYSTVNLWNGLRIEDFSTTGGPGWGGVWMDNVERLEVLKGPSSVLYGRNEPGGTVNIVTKRPAEDFSAEARLTAGSFSQRSAALDVGGPIDRAHDVLVRMNVANESSGSYFTHDPDYHSFGAAGVVEWRVAPQTSLVFEAMYRSLRGTAGGNGMPLDPDTNQIFGPLALSSLTGNASEFRQARFFAHLTHAFGPNWSLSLKAMRTTASTPELTFDFLNNGYFPQTAPGSLIIDRMLGRTDASKRRLTALAFDVQGKVEAFGAQHNLLIGGDFYHRRASFTSYFSCCHPTDFFNQAPITPSQYETPVDGFDPDFGPGFASSGDSLYVNRDFALHIQDQIALPGNFHLLAGARFQRIEERTATNDAAGNPLVFNPKIRRSVVSPRAGLVWNPLPWFSTYYSYSENIGSNNALAFPDTPLDPETSRQHEAGVKGEWFAGRLNATLAIFDLAKRNVATEDFDHPGFVQPIGRVRSRGFELNVQGELTSRWSLVFNVSHARPVVTEGTGEIPVGELLPYLPNTTANLWTTWQLPQSVAPGVRISGGLDWASRGNLYPGHSLSAPAYLIAAAFASYEATVGKHALTFQLNVDNIFNKRYFNSLDGQRDFGIASVALGSPRRVLLTLRLALQ